MSIPALMLRKEMFSARRFADPDVPFPWLMPSADAEPFDEPGNIEVPAPGAGDTAILTFRCPVGFQGLLLGHQHQYFGTGFIQGSGGLLWRIAIDGNFPRGLGAMPFEMGALQQNRPLFAPVRFVENQEIVYSVNVPALSPVATGAGNYTIAAVAGWLYPMESRRTR